MKITIKVNESLTCNVSMTNYDNQDIYFYSFLKNGAKKIIIVLELKELVIDPIKLYELFRSNLYKTMPY